MVQNHLGGGAPRAGRGVELAAGLAVGDAAAEEEAVFIPKSEAYMLFRIALTTVKYLPPCGFSRPGWVIAVGLNMLSASESNSVTASSFE